MENQGPKMESHDATKTSSFNEQDREMSEMSKKYIEIYKTHTDKKPPPYIICMLNKEIRWKPRDVNGSGLYLAGNNRFLTSERVSDMDVVVLCQVLKNKSAFVVINLSYNNLGNEAAMAIAQYLKEVSNLIKLNLMCNEITEEGAEAIATSLGRNSTLRVLIMNGNKIGKRGALAFAQVLQINKGLRGLDIGHTDQTIDGIIALAVVLQSTNSSLFRLNISRPLLKGQDHECVTVHMGQLLKSNKTLTELNLAKIDIRDFGATRIADALAFNKTLTHLNLSSNRIGEDGAKVLSEAILASNTLEYLDIGYNRIKDPGVKYITEMLQKNTSLETLILVYNEFGKEGLLSLISTLKQFNRRLSALFIWGNEFHPDACKAFAELLKRNRLLTENVDVMPYEVDRLWYFGQLNHHPNRHFYWAPSYGDDVPYFQIYGNGFEKMPAFNFDVRSLT